jgi:hypothetical protein
MLSLNLGRSTDYSDRDISLVSSVLPDELQGSSFRFIMTISFSICFKFIIHYSSYNSTVNICTTVWTTDYVAKRLHMKKQNKYTECTNGIWRLYPEATALPWRRQKLISLQSYRVHDAWFSRFILRHIIRYSGKNRNLKVNKYNVQHNFRNHILWVIWYHYRLYCHN